MSDLRDRIEKALLAHGLQYAQDDDGNPYPLVDALSMGSDDIGPGRVEIELLAEALAEEIEGAMADPTPAPDLDPTLRGALEAYHESPAWWEESEDHRYCLHCEESAPDEIVIDHAASCPRVLGASALASDAGEAAGRVLAAAHRWLDADAKRDGSDAAFNEAEERLEDLRTALRAARKETS